MDETTARSLLSLALALDRAVADLMGIVARDLVLPIEHLHPALRPAP